VHLLFVTNLYPPYVVGGNEMLCDDVVQGLRRRGHQVSVLCGRGRDLPAHPDVVGGLELDLDRKEETLLGGRLPSAMEAVRLHVFSLASYAATRRAIAARRPDLVVVWNLYMASMAPLVAAARSGRPVVVHVCDKWLYFGLHDLEALLVATVWWKRAALKVARGTVQPLLRRLARPHHLVAISDFMKAFYVAAGVDPDAIDVVRLGIPTGVFTFAPRAPRAGGAPLQLLFVGSLWEGKGPHTAVRALGRLIRSGVRAHLDVCGSGPESFAKVLHDVIAEEGVAAAVTLHGRVGRDAVRRFCQARDVLVFPSEWDEPFAAVPVEAMSCGMAVVATTAGGTPEAVVDGETGLLVPPGDPDALAHALRRLAEDDDLRIRLGENGARAARARFDLDGYVDRLEARYRELAASARPKRRSTSASRRRT
jgi:glycosyltransferase involved in cell wall biosynthesis